MVSRDVPPFSLASGEDSHRLLQYAATGYGLAAEELCAHYDTKTDAELLELVMHKQASRVVLAALRNMFSEGVRMELRTEYVWVLGLVVAATLLHFVTFAVAVEVEGSRIDWVAAVTDRMLPAVLVNVGIALALYWVVRLPTRRLQPRVI